MGRIARWTAADVLEAVDRKDTHTGRHARAVARLSALVGLEMGLPTCEIGALLIGALLHDVGKIFVPDAILKKPGPLTPEERKVVELHPIAGSQVLEYLRVLPASTAAVKHHHERYDGNGYPEGLCGEEIPLAARIILATDAFDSMVRDRSYRQGITSEKALEEITSNAGTQFDPKVVQALKVTTTGPVRTCAHSPKQPAPTGALL